MRTDSRDLLAVGILGNGSRIGERVEMLLRRGRGFTETVSLAGVAAGAFALLCIMLAGSMVPRWMAFAQAQGPRPVFEVASVKPIDREKMRRDHEGNRLDAGLFVDRTDLLQFIVRAYLGGGPCLLKTGWGEDCPLISGNLPAWIKTDRFEIQASLPANAYAGYTVRQLRDNDTPQLNQMLQVLLEDRFHLKVHREIREIPVYVLTVGKNGPKLTQTPPGGELRKAADGSTIEVHGVGRTERSAREDGTARVRAQFQASSMQNAADSFAMYFDRPVLDRTGLKGDYDFVVEFEQDPEAPNLSPFPGNPFRGLTGPALSAALEAVGIKLESTKAPVEILVIDHAEKPDAN